MKLRIQSNRMEEVEGLSNAYPYAYHYADLSRTVIPWHWHEALEFDYVRQGSVTVSTPSQTRTFQTGEGFFINSNALTAMQDGGGCILDSHLFHPVFLSGHFKSIFETKYLDPVIQNRNLDLLPLGTENPLESQLLHKLRQLTRLQQSQDMEFQTRSVLGEIWLLLLDILKDAPVKKDVPRNQERILTMLAFIQANYAEKLTLESIAASAAISTRECLRCFQSTIHQTPIDYLIDYRVQAAAKLLETTDLSVTDVAMATGWGSSSYFTKMFSRLMGRAPNAYRKGCRS